ncbi:MAG: hypothetical protein NXH91_17165 [Phyllobacteriaceae bacterium]|jgi:hypothetical protein|nr:hypothetical protein [Phyllobacteriaceae bacterium]
MENPNIIIPVCEDHKQQIEQLAEYFGWESAGAFIGAILNHEISRAEDQMHAELFRMHRDDFEKIIEARKQGGSQNHLN